MSECDRRTRRAAFARSILLILVCFYDRYGAGKAIAVEVVCRSGQQRRDPARDTARLVANAQLVSTEPAQRRLWSSVYASLSKASKLARGCRRQGGERQAPAVETYADSMGLIKQARG
jgi:hypothetical protein